MKYIKLFESEEFEEEAAIGRYWLLPTDYRFEESLIKIGCPEYLIKRFLDNENIPKDYFVFIGVEKIQKWGNDYWGWNICDGYPRDRYYDRREYTYMGIINTEDWEFKIKTQARKYNI